MVEAGLEVAHRVLSPSDQRELVKGMVELLVARHRSVYTGVRISYVTGELDELTVVLEGEGAKVMAGLLPGMDPTAVDRG